MSGINAMNSKICLWDLFLFTYINIARFYRREKWTEIEVGCQDTSDPGHFGTVRLVPKCPCLRAISHWREYSPASRREYSQSPRLLAASTPFTLTRDQHCSRFVVVSNHQIQMVPFASYH